jgi:hypothetical protein
MGRASALHRLQQVDTEMLRRQTRDEQITAILTNSSELQNLQRALEDNQARLETCRLAVQQAELAAHSQREKTEHTERTLYGGTVTNPKELQDLQLEAESLKRHLQTLEDRLLEVLLEQDEIQTQRTALTEQLTAARARRESEHASLLSEQSKLRIELENLLTEREAAAASIVPEDLARYEALARRLGGLSVATVEEGTCGACGLTITPSMQQSVRSGHALVPCPQCGRILYAG